MKMKLWMMAAILLCGPMTMLAQVPAEVIDVMKKCEAKMDNPAGLEMDCDVHAKVLVISMNGTLKSYSKGKKSRDIMSMKAMGQDFSEESGFDGVNEWIYKKAESKKTKDSLIIKKADKNSEANLDMEMYKDYKNAKMKISGKYYEITFTGPLKKDDPKKMIIKIDKDNYNFREMWGKQGPGSMRVTVKKIKIGVSDDVFKLDPKNYPGAVVVRK